MEYKLDLRFSNNSYDESHVLAIQSMNLLRDMLSFMADNILVDLTVWNTNTGKWEYVAG